MDFSFSNFKKFFINFTYTKYEIAKIKCVNDVTLFKSCVTLWMIKGVIFVSINLLKLKNRRS